MPLFKLPSITKALLAFCLILCTPAVLAQSITNPIAALKNHITGAAPLTAAQIVTQGNSIQTNIRQVGTNAVALAAALDLVATFDASANKPLFTSGSTTYSGFTRDGTGDELAQALFDLQQGIMDWTYNAANLVTYYSQVNNTKFGTSTYFPGAVTQPANTNQGYSVVINATQPKAWGAPVLYQDFAARRPTGCYLAPGSIAYVTVPAALVNQGYNVRVGAHYWDMSAKDTLKRLDRVSLVYPITSTTTRIANPLGGGIYIEVPYQKTNGLVTVGITNVVRSPLFRATSFHQTTAAEWLTERTQPGKWADFESDKFMMQVPRSWIYNFTGAAAVMRDWDNAMDAVSDLMGLPQVRSKTVLYLQPDVLFRAAVNAPGYPQVNDTYNPNTAETGNKDHYLLTGPQDSGWAMLHELGHAQTFTKFTGETESAVNLLYVAVLNQKFGLALGAAHGLSIGAVDTPANSSITVEQAALSWIMVDNFRANNPMDDTDMKYQHRGHGKYSDIAHLFGWAALGDFWRSVHVDYTNGIDYPENTDPTDSRILRMSKAVGTDLTPLIYMWGMKPANVNNLKTSIANAGLKPSVFIYDRLKYYQSIVPTNLAQFQTHYQAINSSTPANDAAWYQTMNTQFTPSIGYASITQLQNIINLYFPNGRPAIGTNRWSGAISATWNTNALNWKTVAAGTATNYVGGNPGDYVLFDDALTGNPAITLTGIVSPASVTFSNHATAYSLSGSGRIAGAGPLFKQGTGTATINTSNLFSGGISASSGTLVLNGVNAVSTTTVSSNAAVRAGKTGALGEGGIVVGTAQADTCRLELTGGITVANPLGFRPRNSANNLAAHFLNISGTNFLSPPADLPYGTGGNVLSLQSDSGRLVLTVGMNVSGSAPRVAVLQGVGDGEVQGPISTNAALLKLGTGTWTLSGSSSMAYGVMVSNGTLAPGLSFGKLTLNSNLTLQGVAVMKIARHGPSLTNDWVTGVKTNTYGGTLIVTNVGSSALQVGDSFKLFAASRYAGAFANFVYPAGHTFSNSLAVDGKIWVMAVPGTTPPNFPSDGIVQLPGGNISLTATGAVGTTYKLWASTNVALTPVANLWTLLTNGTIGGSPFTIIDDTATNHPQRFYRFSTP